MEVRRGARVGGPAAGAGRRGAVRPHHRQPHPAWGEVRPLARRQGPGRVHAGPAARVKVRPARLEDETALLAIDRATWSPLSGPAPEPSPGPFFNERTRPENVLIAEIDGRVVGWGKI